MIGEEKGKAVCCVCVFVCEGGKHVGSVVKKSLLDCWSTVEGCLPVSTPPGLSDLRFCVLCLIVCMQLNSTTENLRLLQHAFTLCVFAVSLSVKLSVSTLCSMCV